MAAELTACAKVLKFISAIFSAVLEPTKSKVILEREALVLSTTSLSVEVKPFMTINSYETEEFLTGKIDLSFLDFF